MKKKKKKKRKRKRKRKSETTIIRQRFLGNTKYIHFAVKIFSTFNKFLSGNRYMKLMKERLELFN